MKKTLQGLIKVCGYIAIGCVAMPSYGLFSDGRQEYQIKLKDYDACLDISGGVKSGWNSPVVSQGQRIVIHSPCKKKPDGYVSPTPASYYNQAWTGIFERENDYQSIVRGYVPIYSRTFAQYASCGAGWCDWNNYKDACLDLYNGKTTNQNYVQIWECNGYPAQIWKFVPRNDDLVTFQILGAGTTNKCLDAKEVRADDQVVIHDCHGGANQDWQVLRMTRSPYPDITVTSVKSPTTGVAGGEINASFVLYNASTQDTNTNFIGKY